MAITEQLKNLVDQMPDADRKGMLTGEMNKQQIEKAVAAIAKGGRENILGIIEMLAEPGSPDDVNPHYALHCVVNHALITRDENMRKEFCEAIASQLGNKKLHPVNREYLCQELQWAGGDEACEALGSVLLDEDVTDAAATALVAIGGERAASQLRTAAGKAEGKARLNLIDALAAVADAQSADTLQAALKDKDREVRIAAAIGLANIGDARATEPIFQAAEAAEGWERTQTTKACLVLAEKLAAAGKSDQARKIYQRLQKTRTDKTEQHIRDAVKIGLAAIA